MSAPRTRPLRTLGLFLLSLPLHILLGTFVWFGAKELIMTYQTEPDYPDFHLLVQGEEEQGPKLWAYSGSRVDPERVNPYTLFQNNAGRCFESKVGVPMIEVTITELYHHGITVDAIWGYSNPGPPMRGKNAITVVTYGGETFCTRQAQLPDSVLAAMNFYEIDLKKGPPETYTPDNFHISNLYELWLHTCFRDLKRNQGVSLLLRVPGTENLGTHPLQRREAMPYRETLLP